MYIPEYKSIYLYICRSPLSDQHKDPVRQYQEHREKYPSSSENVRAEKTFSHHDNSLTPNYLVSYVELAVYAGGEGGGPFALSSIQCGAKGSTKLGYFPKPYAIHSCIHSKQAIK